LRHPTPTATLAEPTAHILDQAERGARGGRIEDALAACEAVRPRLVDGADPWALGRCEHVQALCYYYGGRIKESVLAGYRAIGLLVDTPDVSRLVQVLTLQAGGLARLGAAQEASALLERATALLPQLDDGPRELCRFWTNVAVVHHASRQFEQAQASARQALALAEQVDDADLKMLCVGNALSIGVEVIVHAPHPDPARLAEAVAALATYLEARIAESRHDLVPDGVEALCDGFSGLGDADAARRWLALGIASAGAIGSRLARAQLELRLARLDRRAGAHAEATAHLARALEGLAEGGNQEELAAAHLERSALQEAQHDWRGALESFKSHSELREAALRAQADTRTQAMAMRLELERSRLEAELLRRRNEELQDSMTRLSDEAGEFRRQAMEDPLTGLANRRQLEAGVAQLARLSPDTPQLLLIADLDHFKRINDGWSHAVGDEVLKTFAGLLRAQSRPLDVLARVGGEEFVVALAGAVSTTRAMLVAERLRAAVEGHDWGRIQPGMAVTTSIGVAARAPGEPLADALRRADAALYQCKRSGRNQVRCAG
jgi:diguanylate cyclase (GGDEF)-like protein